MGTRHRLRCNRPTGAAGDSVFQIANDRISLALDEAANLTSLASCSTGHDYAGGAPMWRLYYRRGQRFQREIVAEDQTPIITQSDEVLLVEYPSLQTPDGVLPIRIRLTIILRDDETHWSAEIENATADVCVKELQYPLIDRLTLHPAQELITTEFGGQRYRDPRGFARRSARHPYCDEDFNGVQTACRYPGLEAACNCFVFAASGEGLYFGCHDNSFRTTLHHFRILQDDLEAGFVQHLFLPPGGRISTGRFVISAYQGTWHTAARKYRAWADSWFTPRPKPDWITRCYGWQRLIFKQQNGEILYRYDSLPGIFADGAKSGIRAILMFGWWPGGMDRMYPEYRADEEMGGEAALRENIRRFQEDCGGEVILYASGRLVDRESGFFGEKGQTLAVKTIGGADVRDPYLFANRSTFERCYGAVELTPMCTDCREWIDELKKVVDLAVLYGCKGVFFDQLGSQEYPCCDPGHGHPVPYLTQTAGKRRALAELRQYAKQRDPDLAFGIEIVSDATADMADFIHGVYFQTLFAQNADWEETGEKARYTCFVDWTRYTFPELVISDRDIRDDTDIKRRVNWAFQRGLVHDVEIFRCRRTIAETPHYQAYLARVNALRDRYGDLLVQGRYIDTEGFTIDGNDVDARAFLAGRRMAVVLCQSHRPILTTSLAAAGYRLVDHAGVGGIRVDDQGGTVCVTLERHGLVVVLFERP